MKSINRREFCRASGLLCASALAKPAFSINPVPSPSKSGYAFDKDFTLFWNNSAETYFRAEWINARLEQTGVRADLDLVLPYSDPMEYIRKLHTAEHIGAIDSMGASHDFSLTIGQVARKAVSHVLGAVQAVCEGSVRNAFCCIRPPGHHVQNTGELGYCCYANVVLAAHFAREKFNLRRILIIDWDFHQGNGTHGFICGDNDILFFETYNPTMYTTECNDFNDTTDEKHPFPADAKRINIHMPDESTNDDFIRVFETRLVPAAEHFKPELVLISCGFDLKKYDSHGNFLVTANGMSRLTRIVRQIADTYAGGRLVSMLEGGYVDTERDGSIPGDAPTFSGLAQCAENHVKTLITGNEYPETPYYKNSSSISLFGSGRKQGALSEIEGTKQITLTGYNGRVVKKLSRQNGQNLPLDELHVPAGRYILESKGKSGEVYRATQVVK